MHVYIDMYTIVSKNAYILCIIVDVLNIPFVYHQVAIEYGALIFSRTGVSNLFCIQLQYDYSLYKIGDTKVAVSPLHHSILFHFQTISIRFIMQFICSTTELMLV